MDISKYDGSIHPDEWVNELQTYFNIKNLFNLGNVEENIINLRKLNIAKSLVDSTILLPTGIDSFEKLCNALKKDISFTVFKNTNKRKLQSLKYIPEREGGDTSKFISTFRKLCYNAEINDIEEQKKYLYNSLPMDHFNYISNEFIEKMKNVNSINELIKEFEDIVLEESILIKKGSIVALKHISTGKYLNSIENLCYETGSKKQLVFVDSLKPSLNSLWKIEFNKELATYTGTYITLQHIKSNKLLGIYYNKVKGQGGLFDHDNYYKSPLTEHTEVSCNGNDADDNTHRTRWKLNHSNNNHQGYLKSNDVINLMIKKVFFRKGIFLRSHDVQFTIGNKTFQEVICHNERLGGIDEWCIELIEHG